MTYAVGIYNVYNDTNAIYIVESELPKMAVKLAVIKHFEEVKGECNIEWLTNIYHQNHTIDDFISDLRNTELIISKPVSI